MRHNVAGRKLNRTTAHRRALRRNLVQSLIEHGEIRTTLPKAKEVQRFAERLATLAIDGSLAARQRAIALLNDRAIIAKEQQEEYDKMSDAKRAKVLRARSGRRYRASTTKPGVKFTADSVIHKLFAELGPRFKSATKPWAAPAATRASSSWRSAAWATGRTPPCCNGWARTTRSAPRARRRRSASAAPVPNTPPLPARPPRAALHGAALARRRRPKRSRRPE